MISTRCFGLIAKSKSVFQFKSLATRLYSSTYIPGNICQQQFPSQSRNILVVKHLSWQHSNLHKYLHSSSLKSNHQKNTPKQTSPATPTNEDKSIVGLDLNDEKLGLFARFKKMSKEYWYVLLPVHVLTSSVWFGGFYYLSVR